MRCQPNIIGRGLVLRLGLTTLFATGNVCRRIRMLHADRHNATPFHGEHVRVMRPRGICLFLTICWLIPLWHGDMACAEQGTNCVAARKGLAFKKQQLADHMDAMKKLYDQNEMTIMAIMNHKIGELIEEVARAEEVVRPCPDAGPSPVPSGLGAVKSETSEYASKSCEELRTLLFQLLQKTSALKRREGSLFSALSSGEKTALLEAEQAFKDVKAAIKSKCAHEDSHPFRGRPRAR
jgi:hypothetical protein